MQESDIVLQMEGEDVVSLLIAVAEGPVFLERQAGRVHEIEVRGLEDHAQDLCGGQGGGQVAHNIVRHLDQVCGRGRPGLFQGLVQDDALPLRPAEIVSGRIADPAVGGRLDA